MSFTFYEIFRGLSGTFDLFLMLRSTDLLLLIFLLITSFFKGDLGVISVPPDAFVVWAVFWPFVLAF
jgi:hypothetical protein